MLICILLFFFYGLLQSFKESPLREQKAGLGSRVILNHHIIIQRFTACTNILPVADWFYIWHVSIWNTTRRALSIVFTSTWNPVCVITSSPCIEQYRRISIGKLTVIMKWQWNSIYQMIEQNTIIRCFDVNNVNDNKSKYSDTISQIPAGLGSVSGPFSEFIFSGHSVDPQVDDWWWHCKACFLNMDQRSPLMVLL